MSTKKLHIDIETFSSEPLKDTGSYRYLESVDFEILIVAYAFGKQPIKVVDLAQGEALPEEFTEALLDPSVEKHAHNANFERNGFRAIGYDVAPEQWHCSSVKAGFCGLPLSLDNVSKALDLGDKSKSATGKNLIKYFSIPCKPTKTNGGRTRNLPEHDPEKWDQYKEYCRQDVEAERAVGEALEAYHIGAEERHNYIIDQRINDRGILIDLDLARAAVALNEQNAEALRDEMIKITGLSNPNSGAQLTNWLSLRTGKNITSVAKDNVKELIEDESVDPTVRRVLELRQRSSKTSIKKYIAMINAAGDDGRVRGTMQFYGAWRTGRWAGRILQPQNMTKPRLEEPQLGEARDDAKNLSYADFKKKYGEVSDMLSQLIRTALIARDGHTFAVADFSAIEARVIAWLACETWRLDVFKSHGMIYEASASAMFGVPIEDVDKALRAKGKVAELALGYQGAIGALRAMGADKMGLTDDEMTAIVKKWRKASPRIVALWKDLEQAAAAAMQNKGRRVTNKTGLLKFRYDGKILRCLLPSGRAISYYDPQMRPGKWGGSQLTYMGTDQKTRQWVRLDSYGGKIVENVVQAIARDIMAYSLASLERHGYPVIMHVHDEAVAEVRESDANLAEMCETMATLPDWADGLPLSAEGYLSKYYKKD